MKSSYVKTKFNHTINVSELVTIHYYEFDRSFSFEGEAHDFWEMVYIDSGSVEIHRDGEPLFLNQGEIIFHKPNEFHTIKAHNSSPNFFVISFVCRSAAMAFFTRFTTKLSPPLKPFIASIIKEAEATYVIPKNDTKLKKLNLKEGAPIGGEQLIKSYLEQFLILLLRHMTEKKSISIFPTRESMENRLVSDIEAYIKGNLDRQLRIGELCRVFGYSKSYLSYLFKAQSSRSLVQFYNECRIEEAKRLIREGLYSFTEIAERLGFDNPQYFARTFRRLSGLSPTEFKNSLNLS